MIFQGLFSLVIAASCVACVSTPEVAVEPEVGVPRGVATVDGLTDCGQDALAGARCLCEVAALRPTQLAVGMRAVREKETHVNKKMSKEKLEKYLSEHPEPAVVGPDGGLYIIDHHHLGRALLNQEIEITYCEILENLRHMGFNEFWQTMEKKSWVYLYDENGKGPLSYSSLPSSLAGLKDDPYRSLAGAVREADGYEKSPIPFAEFQWAAFFRTRIARKILESDFEQAILDGVELAQSPAAAHLPGYRKN